MGFGPATKQKNTHWPVGLDPITITGKLNVKQIDAKTKISLLLLFGTILVQY